MKKTVIVFLVLFLAMCLTGCQKNTAPTADVSTAAPVSAMEEYVANAKTRSDAIWSSLEQEGMTQTDMNQKSEELSALWDAAMDHLMNEASKSLSAADMEKLTAAQNEWKESRKNAVEAAGKEVEGGSMYGLAVNCESAKLTEKRVYELLEQLK